MTKYVNKKIKNRYMEIDVDEYAESPREFDDIVKMLFIHKRYDLGDKHECFNPDSFDSWDDIKQYIQDELSGMYIRKVYMLDHSGLSISLRDFCDSWDSGVIGFVYIPAGYVQKYKIDEEQANNIISSSIEEYDNYLRGEIYRFYIYDEKICDCCDTKLEEHVDSCCGFIGDPKESMSGYVDFEEWEEI